MSSLARQSGFARNLPRLALLLVFVLTGGAIVSLTVFAFMGAVQGQAVFSLGDSYLWRVIRFTLWQAFLSTFLSIVFAIPVVFLLNENRRFIGREFLLRIFALPLVLPQIVAVLAIVSLYGNQGYFTRAVEAAGVDIPSVYGLAGILIAHVFFNMPLVVRIVLGALQSMPDEYERLSHQLSMTSWTRLRLVIWPYMRPALFNAAALVFMLCVTSFTVVLTLGGGPRATTLEVAIYQALTFDFDIPRAVILTLCQLLLTGFAVFAFARAGGGIHTGVTLNAHRPMVQRRSMAQKLIAIIGIGIAAVFVTAPFIAITVKGIAANLIKLLGQEAVQNAILTSFVLGFLAAILCIVIALALSEGAVRSSRGNGGAMHWVFAHAASLVLVIPPIVIAAGWFITLRPFVHVYSAAPYLVVTINAVMALPFAMRFVLPARQVVAQRHDRLCAQLGIEGINKYRLVLLPLMMKPLSIAFAFALALSLGDLGVIALFGSENVQTLPYLILQRMGSYRTDDAAGLAFILCCLTMALMLFADRSKNIEMAGTST